MKENIQYLPLASLVRISKGEQHAAATELRWQLYLLFFFLTTRYIGEDFNCGRHL